MGRPWLHIGNGVRMRPAEQLTGHKLSTGWTVLKLATKKPTATGGHFSTGYIVQHEDGRTGFLKAMDYTEALSAFDTPTMMKVMSESYLFEKNICQACKDSHLSHVTHAIEHGSILPDTNQPFGKV